MRKFILACLVALPLAAQVKVAGTITPTDVTLPTATVVLSFSATPTFTCPSSIGGMVVNFLAASQAPVVLTGNITSSTLSNCTVGSILNFLLKQDGTGGRTVVMPSGFDAPLVHPAANATTKLTYFYDGANGRLISATSDQGYSACGESSAPGANPPSTVGYLNCDAVRHTQTYLNSSGQTHILPRTAGSTDQLASTDLSDTSSISRTIASGTATMGTSAIAAGACATVVTVSKPGVLTSDVINWSYAATATGYTSATGSGLVVQPVPTADNVNFYVCNPTAGSITPGAVNLNFSVRR